jgi:hypothetical protein
VSIPSGLAHDPDCHESTFVGLSKCCPAGCIQRAFGCVQVLKQELAYGRVEHEAWLRGAGRKILSDNRRELLGPGWDWSDDAAYEQEVEAQLRLFDMCASRASTPLLAVLASRPRHLTVQHMALNDCVHTACSARCAHLLLFFVVLACV